VNALFITLRVIGIVLAFFNLFALAWSTWSLSSLPIELPRWLAVIIVFFPVIAMLMAALLTDGALREQRGVRQFLAVAVTIGVVASAVNALNSAMFSQGPNVAGLAFHVVVGVLLAALFLRAMYLRPRRANPSTPII